MAHLNPPRRMVAPHWMRRPLGRLQSGLIAWPQAWAALLLLVTGAAHVTRAASQFFATTPAVLIGLFGISYFFIGVMLRHPSARGLLYGAGVTAVGLALGLAGFITEFDKSAGVNWFAMATLLVDVLIVPLCLAGVHRS